LGTTALHVVVFRKTVQIIVLWHYAFVLISGDWETVTFSASKSYDPDVNRLASPSLLSCTWYCLTGQWNWTTVQQQAQTSFKDVEGLIDQLLINRLF